MLARTAIYLDSNAGAPLKPSALEALLPFLKESVFIPNPSSIHSHGRQAKRALAEARERIALSLGQKTDPEQLVFTSSGTEANQLAIRSVLEPKLIKGERPHWITTPVEHDSNLQMVAWLERRGGSVSYLPLNSNGIPQVAALESLRRPETALVSSVWVNNETGVMTPVAQLAELTRSLSLPLHLDGAQAWGKLPIDLDGLNAQFVTFSGHKIGGLAGTGILWLGKGNPAYSVIPGKQEKGRRGGTENVLGLIALGAAAKSLNPLQWAPPVTLLRNRLQEAICERIPGTLVNGGDALRVANTLNLSFEGIEGDGLIMALDLAGFSVSSGSACASGVLEPSHVLLAMGRTKAQAMAAIRVSLVDEMDWVLLEGFVSTLDRIVTRMKTHREKKRG